MFYLFFRQYVIVYFFILDAELIKIQELLSLFTNLIDKKNLMRAKSLYNFLERNLFMHKDAHRDWLIVATELKIYLNNKLIEKNGLVLIT